jgi:hypothetical protein
VKADAQAMRLTHTTPTAVVIRFIKLTGIGAGLTSIGLLAGYKPRAYSRRATIYLTQQLTHVPWLQYGVTAVGYHGIQRSKTVHRPRQLTKRGKQTHVRPDSKRNGKTPNGRI